MITPFKTIESYKIQGKNFGQKLVENLFSLPLPSLAPLGDD
jgi:hypothetical protein